MIYFQPNTTCKLQLHESAWFKI